MTHGRQELALGLVRRLELLHRIGKLVGTLLDTGLELQVQALEFLASL